jgi:hypothetical protein
MQGSIEYGRTNSDEQKENIITMRTAAPRYSRTRDSVFCSVANIAGSVIEAVAAQPIAGTAARLASVNGC